MTAIERRMAAAEKRCCYGFYSSPQKVRRIARAVSYRRGCRIAAGPTRSLSWSMLSPHPSFRSRRDGADAQSVYLFEKDCTWRPHVLVPSVILFPGGFLDTNVHCKRPEMLSVSKIQQLLKDSTENVA
ncbi:hypothetical protein Y032_0019g3811 [Ancylostoma ceylanicum]|uniref:Uncharacterized protein n=1 Tax=Ancylostoma ceylanicum TaxID=53326 RepID=A0A016V2F3_9BILA|nr:hypothetical protein Y032_0019g3811 [Ancylostoma ceylanicum]